MALSAKEITKVIVNTLPDTFWNNPFNVVFPYSLNCFNQDKNKKVFHVLLTMRILDHTTKEKLFEFKIETDIGFEAPDKEEALLNLAYTFFATARDGFNDRIKECKSNIARNKSYPEIEFKDIKDDMAIAFAHCVPFNSIGMN